MKNSFRILSACLAASLAFVSCDKESLTKSDNGASKEGARVVTVSFSHTTKSDLGADGLTPHFTDGDVIKVFSGQNKEDCTVSVGHDGTATISIKSDELKTGTLTAVYPASAWSNLEPYFMVSTEQDGTFAKANICTATIPDDVNSKVKFVNQTAILKFYVDNSIGVKKIEIDGKGVATSGDKITVTPASGETLYNVGGGPDPRICYAAVLPVSGKEITLTGTATSQTQPRTIPSATLAANTIFNAFIPYYIDLGTAGKWGYCNVGAFLPEEYGLYFAWGEVNGHNWSGTPNDGGYLKSAFVLDFKFFDHSDSRYAGTWDASSGFADCNTPYFNGKDYSKYKDGSSATLEQSDDAAYQNWGDSWRMPTSAELADLMALDHIWQTDYNGTGVNGREFRNKNTVFFPAAGFGVGADLQSAGNQGYYWSSSLNTDYPSSACYFGFDANKITSSNSSRYSGWSVRPLFSDTK